PGHGHSVTAYCRAHRAYDRERERLQSRHDDHSPGTRCERSAHPDRCRERQGRQRPLARHREGGHDPRRPQWTPGRNAGPRHPAGSLMLGPAGYRCIGTGDGGGGGASFGNSQNPAALLAKLLRVDVDGGQPYGIPKNNPFVNKPGFRPEIWAWGLRNPWRFSFDRASGDLYIADVGQNTYEEVDLQPANSSGGENYGWNKWEGLHCYPESARCDPTGFVAPIGEYAHSGGDCSITGGYVYRGQQ